MRCVVIYLQKHETIIPKKAQELWDVTSRTSSLRLKSMCAEGTLIEIALTI